MNLFDLEKEPYKITKPIRLIELFGGIGSQAKALENLKANFEHYRLCEFDKYAVQSYNAVHGTNFETSDVTKIKGEDLGIKDTQNFTYLLTYSFPCQDLSLAGLQKGMVKGSGTRSGLLWEVERLLNECDELPQVLVMENVPMVHSKDNKDDFNSWMNFLESKGYSNYWQDLNAKDYGIPQNRDRCFMVSILNEDSYYTFPKPSELSLRLKDLLEKEVDESYYLSENKITSILNWKAYQKPFEKVLGQNSVSPTLTARGAGEEHSGMILYSDSLDNTQNVEPLLINEKTKKGYAPAYDGDGIYINRPHQKRGCVQHEMIQTLKTTCAADVAVVVKDEVINPLKDKTPYGWHFEQQVYSEDGITRTVKAGNGSGNIPKVIENDYLGTYDYSKSNNFLHGKSRLSKDKEVADALLTVPKYGIAYNSLRIRKLTPKECWRLMGFSDEDVDNAKNSGISNAQLYKQAGNSIVVNVLMAIFKQML